MESNFGTYLEINCLVCGDTAYIHEDQIEQPEYRCPHCGAPMANSQWRRAKVTYYVGEELLRQAAALMGDESSAVEVRAFDVACYGPGGLPLTFDTSCHVKASPKDMKELEEMGMDVTDWGNKLKHEESDG